MTSETMTDPQADALIEAVGERMGMHQGAWDMVSGRELARAFAAELRAAPQDGPVVWVWRFKSGVAVMCDVPPVPDEHIGWAAPADHRSFILAASLIPSLGLAPGACQRFRLVPEGER